MVLPWWRGAMLGLIWLTGVTWLFSGSQECLATNIFPAVITAARAGRERKIIHWLGGMSGQGQPQWQITNWLKCSGRVSRAGPGWLKGSPGWSVWLQNTREELFAYCGNCEIQPMKQSLPTSLIKIGHGLPCIISARSEASRPANRQETGLAGLTGLMVIIIITITITE